MICAVVLAAGQSRRMGAQKLLLPFGGTTVIEHVVDQVLGSTVGGTYVVVGHEPQRIAEQLASRRVYIVTNPDYKSGMLSSARCGLRALPQECDTVLVALGDQPGITSELIDLMVQSFAATDKGICVPTHDGKRGHPLLFSMCYRDEVLTRYDDEGLRGLLWAHPNDIFELSVPTPAVLTDIDDPQDYERELGSLQDGTPGERTTQSE